VYLPSPMKTARALVWLLCLPSCGADQGDGPLVESAAVQAIFAAHCTYCHDPAHPVVPETPTFVALSLTERDAYRALVNQPAHELCGGVLVVPGDTAASYLYAKVTQAAPCEGDRMPHRTYTETTPTPPLPDDQIATIATWNQAGAKR
jgi:hypothetical protein